MATRESENEKGESSSSAHECANQFKKKKIEEFVFHHLHMLDPKSTFHTRNNVYIDDLYCKRVPVHCIFTQNLPVCES